MDHNQILINRILDEILTTRDNLTEIKITLVKNTDSLDYHIKRTDLLEESIELVRKDILPLKTRATYWEGAMKFLGFLALISAIARAAFDFFR